MRPRPADGDPRGDGGRLTTTRLLVVALALTALDARAADTKLDLQARYEDELIQASMKRRGLEPDPRPDGKIIEDIVIDASTVLQQSDFAILSKIPVLAGYRALNKLHVRTRDYVITRELLVKVGEVYAHDRVLESGRNLRSFFILSVARIVAVKGTRPDTVRLLVVTKDQWSLRLNTEFTLDQARLDYLSFSIAENNVAGRNKTAAIDFALDPGRFTIGASYSDPRIWNTRVYGTLAGNIFLRRSDSSFEGGYFSTSVGLPLFSLRSKWAWSVSGSFLSDVARIFKGGALTGIKVGEEIIPIVYARESWNITVQGTRSWGVVNKLNLTWGMSWGARLNQLNDATASFSDDAKAALRRFLPRTERASGPFISLSAFRATYVQLRNIDTFALTEDYRTGPSATFQVTWAAPYFGLESHYLALSASFGHTYIAKDNLLSFGASAGLRIQTDVIPNSPLANESVGASIREVTPKFGPFRLHVFGTILFRHHDLNNTLSSLGSSSGLRGFSARELIGNSYYRVNVELRTLALNLWTLHVGGVLFYDGGDAPASLQDLNWHQDVGVGLRILIPQFNRGVLRLDLGLPFEFASGGSYIPRFSAEFGQAF